MAGKAKSPEMRDEMAAKKAAEKYHDPIETNLGLFAAEIRLLGPDEYSAYLKRQNQLFSGAIKTLN